LRQHPSYPRAIGGPRSYFGVLASLVSVLQL
jgi:hypothetical protein